MSFIPCHLNCDDVLSCLDRSGIIKDVRYSILRERLQENYERSFVHWMSSSVVTVSLIGSRAEPLHSVVTFDSADRRGIMHYVP